VFELLGICLLLAALLTFNSLASLLTGGLWRVFGGATRCWSALSRARLIFVLRTFPAVVAVLCALLLIVPSYLAYEPRHTAENVSFKLAVLAFISAVGIGLAAVRSIAAWRSTADLTADWMAQGRQITLPGVNIETYRIDHAFPVIAIVGVLKPRLFIASHVLAVLTTDEIKASLAHENGHLTARDNLKRGVLRACRDSLLLIPSGRLLDREWSEAAEEAADERAAKAGHGVALDLASALVKIARIIPQGARPTMPAGVFLLGDDEVKGIRSRVGRLVDLAALANQRQESGEFSSRVFAWSSITMLVITLVLITRHPIVFASIHSLIEQAVALLK
jgi:Zn-dependent protease with chaperone function